MGRMKDRFIELQNQQRDKIEAAERGDVRNFNQIVSDEICTGPKVTYGVIRVEKGCSQQPFVANGLTYSEAKALTEALSRTDQYDHQPGALYIWVPDNYKQHLPKEGQREN